MKKTYISPSFIMVHLNPSTAVLNTTSTLGLYNDDTLDFEEEILVKGNSVISDKDLWDDEW